MSNEIHNDDEPILIFDSQDEVPDIELEGGTTEARYFNKQYVPFDKSPFDVLVELQGFGADEGRLGVDLVTVLDISGSMRGVRLLKMKVAMKFLVNKLSRIDRLSVVTFNRHAAKVCPLRQITESSQTEIVDQVNDLNARASTNTEAGLKLALKILKDRTRTKKRSVAIMLMSDGMEDEGISNAIAVPVSEVPVYTFAYGNSDGGDHHELLRDIAKKSKEGTFTPVQDSDDLSVAFSTALAGLLNVSIEDLTLTVGPLNSSQLDKVNAGNYPQTKGTVMEPVTVTFRSLYNRETRKVLANLTLPKVDTRFGVFVLSLVLKYRVNGSTKFVSDERSINITRADKGIDAESPEVKAEKTRLDTASSITEARILADAKELVQAKKKLVDAGKSLKEIDTILKAQVDHLITLMATQEDYDSKGKAFALALEASHNSQRSVALPAGVPNLYDTPIMKEYQKQAAEFNKNPDTYVVPTDEDDKKATTVEVKKDILELAQSLAGKIKSVESQAATGKVDRIKVEEIADLSRMLAEKLKALKSK